MPSNNNNNRKRNLSNNNAKLKVSYTPIWLLVFFINVVFTAIVLLTWIFLQLSNYWLIGLSAFPPFATAMLVWALSHQVNMLTDILRQDPLVVVGDPYAVRKLKTVPWYGVREFDQLQQAVLFTYLAYIEDTPPEGRVGGAISHGVVGASAGGLSEANLSKHQSYGAIANGGASAAGGGNRKSAGRALLDDFDDEASWKSAESLDKDHIDSYLLAQYRSQRKGSVKSGGGGGGGGASSTASRSPRVTDFDSHGNNLRDSDFHSILTGGSTARTDYQSVNSFTTNQDANGGAPYVVHHHHDPQQSNRSSVGAPSSIVTGTGAVATRSGGGGNSNSTALTPRAGQASTVASEGFAGPVEDPLGDNRTSWEEAVTGGVTDPGKSVILQLLSQLRPGQTLTNVTLPFHILEPRSMVERISDVFIHPELLLPLSLPQVGEDGSSPGSSSPTSPATTQQQQLFLTPAQEDLASKMCFFTPQARAENKYWKLFSIFRWFISAYHLKPSGSKKPYNSILGEVLKLGFMLEDFGGNAAVKYLAEQVSHHPPVSAFYAEGAGITAMATYYPKSKLVSPNCAAAHGEGAILLNIKATGERFKITWPTPYASGFVSGNMRMELGGEVVITNLKTKEYLKVEFLRKGWISGSYDEIKGAVYDSKGDKVDKYSLFGIWHGTTYFFEGPKATKSGVATPQTSAVLWDSSKVRTPRPTAMSVDHPKQSRYVWRHLTKALREDNPEAAAPAKHAVEQAQRAERKVLADAGRKHKPIFFKWIGEGVPHEKGCAPLHDPANWMFVGQKELSKNVDE